MQIQIPEDKLRELCKKWHISELAFFGSVLRGDFDPKTSDIDILVTFSPDFDIGWDIVFLKEELEALFGRKVDLVRKEALVQSRNPYRKNSILKAVEVVYEEVS